MKKSTLRQQRQKALLTLFDHQLEDHYEEKRIGNEWYIKQFNGNNKRWQVAVYPKQSYERYKQFREIRRIDGELDNELARQLLKDL